MEIAQYKSFFANKRITLMGLGLLGRGVGDAEFLASLGAELTITDLKSEAKLKDSLERLLAYPSIRYVLGKHELEDFKSADMVIKAAGVPLNSAYIDAAKAAGVPVYMSTALMAKFAREAGATVVGVTGTRGKSTISHLIHYALISAGKRAHLGGNVRGLSTLAMLPIVQQGDIVVLELDSWQLQGFGDAKMSPQVSVFTNLMPDHLNYYPDMESYFSDKANIFRYQKPGDTLVAGAAIQKKITDASPPVPPLVPAPLPESWKLKIVGAHNRENAALAAAALQALGLDEKKIRKAFELFGGVEGRLQHLALIRGVHIYNDNNSTTPEATIAALNALAPLHVTTLIIGGADKKVRLEALAHAIKQSATRVVLIPGSGTDNLKPLLKTYDEAEDLLQALKLALLNAKPGEAIVFSPGFASFSQFQNEYDRNDTFVRAVEVLS